MSRSAVALRIVHPDGGYGPSLHVGDIVRTGENRYPDYEVIAVSGGKAWIRDVQFGTDHVVLVASVHRI